MYVLMSAIGFRLDKGNRDGAAGCSSIAVRIAYLTGPPMDTFRGGDLKTASSAKEPDAINHPCHRVRDPWSRGRRSIRRQTTAPQTRRKDLKRPSGRDRPAAEK